jgi:hypothetical protein
MWHVALAASQIGALDCDELNLIIMFCMCQVIDNSTVFFPQATICVQDVELCSNFIKSVRWVIL